jgi:cellobiose transport system substrate-binding protein
VRSIQSARRATVTTAGAVLTTLALAACGATAGDGAGDDGPITLSVATFNNFGYTADLLAKYSEEHPDVTVELIDAASAEDARTNLTTKLAAGGAGLADVEAVEVDWISELAQYPELFTDLADPELDGRWLDWKVEQGTTPDGKLIGYGTDIGPEAICYRQDLLEKAGLRGRRRVRQEL